MAEKTAPKIPLERQHATNLRRASDYHALVPKSVGEHLDKGHGEVEKLVQDLEMGAIAKGLEGHARQVDHSGKVAPTERDLRLSKIRMIMAQVAHKAYQAGKSGEERQ